MSIKRRQLMLAACGLLSVPAAQAQQGRKVVVGWLGSGGHSQGWSDTFEVFQRFLRTQGFSPRLEIRFAEGQLERLPALATELVKLKPDLIMTADAVSTSAVKKATGMIPIVMTGASDPVGLGLIQSLARPGGNVTGLSSPFGYEFVGKWVEFMRELRPAVQHIATLWNPSIPAAQLRHAQMQRACKSLGLKLLSLEVRRKEDFPQAFDLYRRSDAAGLIVDNAPFITYQSGMILEFAGIARVATIWGHPAPVAKGGLLSYGTDYAEVHRRAAHYAVKILNGTSPSDLPVEQPTKFELVINTKTAKALGIAVPQSILLRADRLIE